MNHPAQPANKERAIPPLLEKRGASWRGFDEEGGQVAPDGMYLTRLVKEHYFTPEPTLSPTAWIIYPGKHSLSLAIQAYQKQVNMIQEE